MPVMDEFQKERDAVRNGTPKQKLSYFVYYYKWYVIAAVLILLAVISLAVHFANQKETAFYACLLNAAPGENAEQYIQSFTEYAGIDTDAYETDFDTSIIISETQGNPETLAAASQQLMIYIAAGNLDVMLTDTNSIRHYANADLFYDLRDFLTPEQLKLYEPYFYYVDWSVVQELKQSMPDSENDFIPAYPDPRKPEEMEQPVPVGIFLKKDCALTDNYYFLSDDVVLSVLSNTGRSQTASRFIDFVMQ